MRLKADQDQQTGGVTEGGQVEAIQQVHLAAAQADGSHAH